jgi:hypothetical protein
MGDAVEDLIHGTVAMVVIVRMGIMVMMVVMVMGVVVIFVPLFLSMDTDRDMGPLNPAFYRGLCNYVSMR